MFCRVLFLRDVGRLLPRHSGNSRLSLAHPERLGRRSRLESLEDRRLLTIAGLGIAGDSLSDEYAIETYSYAENWVELLAEAKAVNVGPVDNWGEPRRSGYEYNWARAGADTDRLLAQGQHTGLAQQITAGLVSHAVLAIGQNDFVLGGAAYSGIYSNTWSGSQIDALRFDLAENFRTALETLDATGVPLVVSNIIDYGVSPLARSLYPDADRREQVTRIIEDVNEYVATLARDFDVPMVDAHRFSKDLLGTNHDPADALEIGGVTFTNTAGVDPHNTFVDDAIHPHTVPQAVFANLFLEGFSQGYAEDIADLTFTERQIVQRAGLTYVEDTFALDYAEYVVLPDVRDSEWIGDLVWEDLDRDGIQDPGEPGVEGVTVTFYSGGANSGFQGDDVQLAVTRTDADGAFAFHGLAPYTWEIPAMYYLEFSDLPPGYEFTAPYQGDDTHVDSNADPVTGLTELYYPGGFLTDTSFDAGMIRTAATIDAVAPLPPDGGTTGAVMDHFNVHFSHQMVPATVNDPDNWELRESGADGQFDTGDDILHGLSVTPSYLSGLVAQLQIAAGPLLPGEYRFTAKSGGLIGPLSRPLDGNGDGVDGDDYVTHFDLVQTAGIRFDSLDVPQDVPDGFHNPPALSTLTIDRPWLIHDLDIELDITHERTADLYVYLHAPDGTRVTLFTYVGGSGEDFSGTVLDDEAATHIEDGSVPFAGRYRPEEPLGAFDGMNAQGTWTLEVSDQGSTDLGVLNRWGLILDSHLATARIGGVDPLPLDGGATFAAVDRLGVFFSKIMETGTVEDAANWELLEAGNDRQFDTSDDLLIPLTVQPYDGGRNAALTLDQGPLPSGQYRFTAKSGGLRDLAGQALDGNDGGSPGGDYQTTFSVIDMSGLKAPGFLGVGLVDSGANVYLLDPLQADISHLGRFRWGTVMRDIAYSPTHGFHGVDLLEANATSLLYSAPIDVTSPGTIEGEYIGAVLTQWSSYRVPTWLTALEFSPTGELYAAGKHGYPPFASYTNNVYQLAFDAPFWYEDPFGYAYYVVAATPVVGLGGHEPAGDLTFDADGDLFLTTTAGKVLKVNLGAGSYQVVADTSPSGNLDGLTNSAHAGLLYAFGQDKAVHQIGTSDGQVARLGTLAHPELDANQLLGATAGWIEPIDLGVVNGTRQRADDAPTLGQLWYRLQVAQNGSLVVDASAEAADLQLYAYNTSGVLAEEASGISRFEHQNVQPGTDYYLRIQDLASPTTLQITNLPGANQPPTATDDYYSRPSDASLDIPARGVLGNDNDETPNALTAHLVDGPTHGDLTLRPDGSFLYTPHQGYTGDDSFTYRASDEELESNVATVHINSFVDLGPVEFLDLNGLNLAAGSLYYSLTTAHTGFLTLEIVAPEPPKSARVQLYTQDPLENAGLAPLVNSGLVDGNQRVDLTTEAGRTYYLEFYGVNTDFDLRIANLVHHEGTSLSVFGTGGDDTFVFDGSASRAVTINGVRYSFTDEEVATVHFDGGEGHDMVEMRDSPGDETLEAWPDQAVFANGPGDSTPDFVVHVAGFEDLQAYAGGGGTDTANLHGSADKDKLKSYEEFVRLRASNSIYSLRAKFFHNIVADAGPEGPDLAVFNGAAGNDIFRYTGDDNTAQMESAGRDHRAVGFDTVIARAGGGTANLAYFTDTPGEGPRIDDVFYFKSHKTKLVGTTLEVTARAFDKVYATAGEGGFDVARIYDTPLDDHFEFDGDAARLYRRIGSELDLLYEVIAFERVKAYRTTGDDTRDTRDHTFELSQFGW